jgi:cysteine-rich repeat protein
MGGMAQRAAAASLGLLVGTSAPLGCGSAVFACNDASDCRAGEQLGTCEADGWCSFPDDTCPSGARYGSHAGGGLAGECVPPGVASTTGDGTGGTSSTSDATTVATTATNTTTTASTTVDATTNVDDSSDSGSDLCGNGALDPGEACDDANQRAGDGCNPGCVAAGEVVWSLDVGAGVGGFDSASSLEMFANGELAAGVVVGNGMTVLPGLWRIAPDDGALVWQWQPTMDFGWDGAFAWGLDIDAAHDERIAYTATGSGSGDGQSVVAMIDANGTQLWAQIVDGTSFGVAVDPAGEVWSGGYDVLGIGTLLHYSADGDLLETLHGEPYSPDTGYSYDLVYDGDRLLIAGRYDATDGTNPAYYRALGEMAPEVDIILADYNEALAIAYDAANDREWVVGYTEVDGGQGWAGAWSHGEIQLAPVIVTDLPQANLHGVAIAASGNAVTVGWQSPSADDDASVVVVTPNGQVLWSRTYPGDGDAALRDVVIGAGGAIFVAGENVGADGTIDGWIARLDP